MTIRLKDKALQKKLDEISNGDFSRALKENLFDRPCSPMDCKVTYRVFFGEPPDAFANRFSAVFRDDEVEDVSEYDPNSWNKWPEVTPPYNVMMRLKMKDGHLRVGYFKEFSDGGRWATQDGIAQILWMGLWKGAGNPVEFFRPWED